MSWVNATSKDEVSRKVIVVGEFSVGKTTLIDSISHGYIRSLSAYIFYYTKVRDLIVKLAFLDTSGIEKYRKMAPMYYICASYALLMFDVTQKISFEELDNWLSELNTHCESNVRIILIGNKKDLIENREVSIDEGLEYAARHDMKYIEITAKDMSDAAKVSELIVNEILEFEIYGDAKKSTAKEKAIYCNII